MNPAAFGMGVCRYHGARRPDTVKRGVDHPRYRHGRETREAKARRHLMTVFFHEAEALMHALDMVTPGARRLRGRKPKDVSAQLGDDHSSC